MPTSIAFALLLALAQAGSSLPAAPPQAAEATPPAGALKPGEKKVRVICRDEAVTGTRMSKRRCISEADFARREEESRASFSAMQGNYTLPATKGN
jgi:hypothetical protein